MPCRWTYGASGTGRALEDHLVIVWSYPSDPLKTGFFIVSRAGWRLTGSAMIFHFGDCILDQTRHRLLCGGEERHVEPQVFALLELLAERAGDVVSRDDLIETVWKSQIVSDATIAARISAARSAVGDNGRNQAIIRTIQRVGVQMVAEVRIDAPSLNSVRNW